MHIWWDMIGAVRMSRNLPFHAWPLQWRLIIWIVLAVLLAVTVYGCLGQPGTTDRPAGAPVDEAAALARVIDAEQRLAALPELRQRAGRLADVPIADVGQRGDTETTGNVDGPPSQARSQQSQQSKFAAATSVAALLAWIEHLVQSGQVRLIAFEPVAANATDERFSGVEEAHAVATDGDSAGDAVLLSQVARLSVEGNYSRIVDLVERIARTEPALLMDAATLRAEGAKLVLEMRIGVAGHGRFRLGASSGSRASAHSGEPKAAASNPFARRSLPDAAMAARLLGTLARAGRRAALLSVGKEVSLVEAGETLGDARVEHVASDAVTLLPFSGGALRVLRLREGR